MKRVPHASALVQAAAVFGVMLLPMVAVQAQTLDDLDVRRESADAVVRVRFNKPIRFQRSVVTRDGATTVINYEVVGVGLGEAQAVDLPSERRLAASAGLPAVAVSDELQGTRASERKLVVRVSPASRTRARAGSDGRSIEVVLLGLGDKVGPSLPITAPAPSATATGWRIVLHSSPDPNMQLPASVPREMQAYDLDTGKRMERGVTLYEFYLGPFASQAEAAAALAAVRPRFAQAAIARMGAETASPMAPLAADDKPAAQPSASASAATTTDPNVAAAVMMINARDAMARGDTAAAIVALGKVLDLPPNEASREAQAQVGELWLKRGDPERARREFELFLKLYPTGADAQLVAAQLNALPVAPKNQAKRERVVPTTTTFSGAVGLYYYGGQSRVRSEEFKDSGLGTLPELVQNPTLSGVDQRLLLTTVDMNYRYRSAEDDLRFVFRDSFQANLMPGRADRNKLSAMYVDYRSLTTGGSIRLGRQSPLGGGVLNRFDGLLAGYAFRPKWKANVVFGRPTDALQQTKRHFYGTSIDADALTENVGGSAYINQQVIDGEVDRRAVGLDLRYFKDGTFVSSNLDYDVKLRALNIAAVQGTWQQIDSEGNVGTTVNAMFDRRAQPLLTLGNALFFQDPNGTIIPVRLSDALALRDIETLRSSVRSTTAYSTQGVLGITTPLTKQWQLGGDIRLTKIDAIAPVAEILPLGQAATGNIWGYGAQLIGTNLYSERDTHVFSTSMQRAPTYTGVLLVYNNMSVLSDGWQVEPSVQFYRQTSADGLSLTRWKPSVRLSWRFTPLTVVETSVDYEVTNLTSPTRNEKTNRVFYYLGARYEF